MTSAEAYALSAEQIARHGIELPADLFGSPLAAMYGAGADR